MGGHTTAMLMPSTQTMGSGVDSESISKFTDYLLNVSGRSSPNNGAVSNSNKRPSIGSVMSNGGY